MGGKLMKQIVSKQGVLIPPRLDTSVDPLLVDSYLPVLPARYFVLLPSWAVGSRRVPPRSPTRC
jgi:hypothetical protein